MTKRERYLRALRNEPVDEIVWAPNFDYWLQVNSAENNLPAKYKGMPRSNIVRAVGGYIWNRAPGLKVIMDKSVREVWRHENGNDIQEFSTPLGSIRAVYAQTEGEHRSKVCREHFVKDKDSLNILKYAAEATRYEPDYKPTKKVFKETKDDGIVLNSCFCVPFIQFAKIDAGYLNGFYLWNDEKEKVDELINVYFKKFLEGYKILADGPADVIATGDDMDGFMISPPIFKEYAALFYQEAKSNGTNGRCIAFRSFRYA